MKAFNSMDGHGMKLLREAGIETAIITGRKSGIVAARAKELNITHVYQGVQDKPRRSPNCSSKPVSGGTNAAIWATTGSISP